MHMSTDTVHQVAKLARLAVPEKEAVRLAAQLGDIISYAEQLQQVDLTDVPPTSHVLDLTNVLREDESKPSLPTEEALRNAPESDGAQVRVPAVLEGP